MPPKLRHLLVFAALSLAPAPLPAAPPEIDPISEVVVTGQRREGPRQNHNGNIVRLDSRLIEAVAPEHVSQLLTRVPGVWVVRGSGQEHQTAIRSPVLGGGGACAGFLFLEDGVPVRPAGFCNVNQFVELYTEQAAAIEVVRGPGNAISGASALHGVVNVLMPAPTGQEQAAVMLDAGQHDFYRARLQSTLGSEHRWLVAGLYAHDGGFREASGYRQGKLHLAGEYELAGGSLSLGLTATDLDQDTAGFIYGEDAYEDEALSRSNPDAGAFRRADAQRVYAAWNGEWAGLPLEIRPFARRSAMAFQHYALPGKPVESNGHESAGVATRIAATAAGGDLLFGFDAEWASVYLEQTQDGPAEGNAVQRATRPQGKHYDYTVDSLDFAAYGQGEWPLAPALSLHAGLRLEYLRYDYDNRMLSGNTRDDGTPCGFGGCVYTRPEDRSDAYLDLAANLGLNYAISERTMLFTALAQGFRPPQSLELYRLQSGQSVAELDSERVNSLEIGLRQSGARWQLELAAFAMRKRDSVFRDADGFSVNGARTRHHGLELGFDWQLAEALLLDAKLSLARHLYDFDYAPRRGEKYISGRDVDSAPRRLGSLQLQYRPGTRWGLGLQWLALGSYFLDTENRYRYSGHRLLDLRADVELGAGFDLALKLENLLDTRYADRADFGGGDYRYLPGRGREWYASLRYRMP